MLRTTLKRQDMRLHTPSLLTFTAALTSCPSPWQDPARPSSSKKAAATRVSTLMLRQMLIALNLSRIIPLLRTTLADRNTSPKHVTSSPRPPLAARVTVPALHTLHPAPCNEAPTLSISVDQLRMFGKELALGTATSTL
ncbi:hypothetical protein GWK47_026287 [Chionoecetes opilio]|uniref:Uncharacterized protein n=1 Tax=Chionoecetes opilio TaxID=41210 RepID=A0A8J8WD89_CHIOP|nr:hypothetical protein GWK47_026287 [Chionoecetes opilio]